GGVAWLSMSAAIRARRATRRSRRLPVSAAAFTVAGRRLARGADASSLTTFSDGTATSLREKRRVCRTLTAAPCTTPSYVATPPPHAPDLLLCVWWRGW